MKPMTRLACAVCVLMPVVMVGARPAAAGVADTVLVADMRSAGYWQRLTMTSLQGIANRDQGRVYLITRSSDQHWLDWYEEQYGVRTRQVGDPYELLSALSDRFRGWAVVDRDAPDTANLAANAAAMDDVVPITADMLRDHQADLPRKSIVLDLRGRFRGQSKAEVYRWAVENQWPELNHAVVANLNVPQKAADISPFTRSSDTLFIRIEDNENPSGQRANIRAVRVLRDGQTVVEIEANTPQAKERVAAEHGSSTGGSPRRESHGAYVTYKVSGVRGADRLGLDITNPYRVSVAPRLEGPYREVAENTTESTRFLLQGRIRDYVVAHRGFSFMLSSVEEYGDERELKGEVLERMTPDGRVYGWSSIHGGSEQHHVRQSSSHGRIVLCSNTATNFSFHQHVEVDGPFRQRQRTDPADLAVDPDKVYLTFVMSDGDSLNFVSNLMHGQWNDSARGQIPFGWEMQPLLADLAPGMLDYFYRTAKPNETFSASASGIGYFFPDAMPEDDLARTLRATGPYLQRTDMATLVLLQTSGGHPRHKVSEEINRMYARLLGDRLLGVQEGYWYTAGENRLVDGLPWMPTRLPTLGAVRNDPIDGMVKHFQEVLAEKEAGRPLFVPFHVPKAHVTVSQIVEALSRLDSPDRFEVLEPEAFFRAYKQAASGEAAPSR